MREVKKKSQAPRMLEVFFLTAPLHIMKDTPKEIFKELFRYETEAYSVKVVYDTKSVFGSGKVGRISVV